MMGKMEEGGLLKFKRKQGKRVPDGMDALRKMVIVSESGSSG